MRKLKHLPIIGGRQFKGEVPEKLSYELWLDRGTIARVAQVLFNEFGEGSTRKTKHNPTGELRPYTDKAVELAAKRYILFNQEDARTLYENKYVQVSDDIWYDYIVRCFNTVLFRYTPEAIREWQKANPEIMDYANRTSSENFREV